METNDNNQGRAVRDYFIKEGICRLKVDVAKALYLKCEDLRRSRREILDEFNVRWEHPKEGRVYSDNHISAWLNDIYGTLHIDGFDDINESICQLFREVAGAEPDWDNWPPASPSFPVFGEPVGAFIGGEQEEEVAESPAEETSSAVAEESGAMVWGAVATEPEAIEHDEADGWPRSRAFPRSKAGWVAGAILVAIMVLIFAYVLSGTNENGRSSPNLPEVADVTPPAETAQSEQAQQPEEPEPDIPPTSLPSPMPSVTPVSPTPTWTPSPTNTPADTATPSATPSPIPPPEFSDSFDSGTWPNPGWSGETEKWAVTQNQLVSLEPGARLELGHDTWEEYIVEIDVIRIPSRGSCFLSILEESDVTLSLRIYNRILVYDGIAWIRNEEALPGAAMEGLSYPYNLMVQVKAGEIFAEVEGKELPVAISGVSHGGIELRCEMPEATFDNFQIIPVP